MRNAMGMRRRRRNARLVSLLLCHPPFPLLLKTLRT